MAEEKTIPELKKEYSQIQKKYDLPSFEELNQDFHIEKICDINYEYLIREVQRFVGEKLSSYLRLIESLLNPSNSPMFVFSIVKLLGTEEKEKLSKIYKKLAKVEVDLLEVDIQFNEEKEVDFIIKNFKLWQECKKTLLEIVEIIKKNWDNKTDKGSKGYFG